MRLLDSYRRTGADLPFGSPERAHGVAMEGYFWRFTCPTTGRVLVTLIGVNRGPRGPWATLGVATHGGGVPARLVIADPDGATAQPRTLGASSGTAFSGDAHHVLVRLPDVEIDVRLTDLHRWSRRRWGGSSVFQIVPGLNQYWHPWLLGGSATGRAVIQGESWLLEGWQSYGEKNWGKGGFPDSWWWGQAQGFDEPEACVAFAGGDVHAGSLRTTVTGLVVRLPDGHLIRLGDPVLSPVHAQVHDDSWHLHGRGFGWDVTVAASAPLHDAHVLPVPLPHERRNIAGALEHLGGDLDVTVSRRGRHVWRGSSRLAGLEHGGLDRAEAELRRRGLPAGTVAAAPLPATP